MPTQPHSLKKDRLPLVISALICPGAGQCMQGRWAVGLFFAAAFTLAFLALTVFTLWPLLYNYSFVTLQAGGPGVTPLPYDARQILICLALTVLLYLWNVADIFWRARRPPLRRIPTCTGLPNGP
ncbi:MAG: hypothetical protein NTV49_12625 [Kiritimatiellaeota bacterium]|nr:hypothetical protein [Kiritimatiellota bacterium]